MSSNLEVILLYSNFAVILLYIGLMEYHSGLAKRRRPCWIRCIKSGESRIFESMNSHMRNWIGMFCPHWLHTTEARWSTPWSCTGGSYEKWTSDNAWFPPIRLASWSNQCAERSNSRIGSQGAFSKQIISSLKKISSRLSKIPHRSIFMGMSFLLQLPMSTFRFFSRSNSQHFAFGGVIVSYGFGGGRHRQVSELELTKIHTS